jgi:hypothetical protein
MFHLERAHAIGINLIEDAARNDDRGPDKLRKTQRKCSFDHDRNRAWPVRAAFRTNFAAGVVIPTVINGITFDGATEDAMQCAIRDALIAFMAATAEAQAEATKEAQRAGIAHAKATRTQAELQPQATQECSGDAREIRERWRGASCS